jgi:hypothetical protein
MRIESIIIPKAASMVPDSHSHFSGQAWSKPFTFSSANCTSMDTVSGGAEKQQPGLGRSFYRHGPFLPWGRGRGAVPGWGVGGQASRPSPQDLGYTLKLP